MTRPRPNATSWPLSWPIPIPPLLGSFQNLTRIVANDQEVEYINAHALPSDGGLSSSPNWLHAAFGDLWSSGKYQFRGSRTCCACRPSNIRRTIRTHGRDRDRSPGV